MSLKEVLKQLGIKLIGWVKYNCVNNLLSDRADLPLAAAQGKVIDEKITALNSNIVTKLSTYTMTSTDDTRQNGYSVGWMVGTNEGYITFNITWICLQFKIASTTCAYRIKFGNNAFSAWKGV